MNQFVFLFSKFFLLSELEVKVAIFTRIVKIPHFSIASLIGVYRPNFTKFSTLVKHIRVCLLCKFDGGAHQKIL